MLGRSWCEINLKQLKENYNICKKNLPKNCTLTAVVKADAYGHGALAVARALQTAGCFSFAVSNLQEGVELRKGGVKGDILILGYTPLKLISAVQDYGLCQTVYSKEFANEIVKTKKSIDLQIAIDTGMSRIGFRFDDYLELKNAVVKMGEKCKIKGIFTHLACADKKENPFSKTQVERFKNTLKSLDGFCLENRHFSNSACFLNGQTELLDSVRLGVCLYGLGDNLLNGIKPILKWKSTVAMVKKIKANESVGYGQTFVAKRDMLIATVTTGYADGFSLALSNLGRVEINGKLAKIVGRVCMDAFMVDVSKVGKIAMGDEVVLLGEKYGAGDMAKEINTIPYEITCSISKRVARVYGE